MNKVNSKQTDVRFIFCPHPVTLDKSKEWGDGNVQNFPNGVFLKCDPNNTLEITHGVKPREDNSAPVGWVKGDRGAFDKCPIFIGDFLPKGQSRIIQTLDGEMNYEAKEDSILCYNGEEEPNMADCYVQTIEIAEANYDWKMD